MTMVSSLSSWTIIKNKALLKLGCFLLPIQYFNYLSNAMVTTIWRQFRQCDGNDYDIMAIPAVLLPSWWYDDRNIAGVVAILTSSSFRCHNSLNIDGNPMVMMIWWQSRQCYDLPSPHMRHCEMWKLDCFLLFYSHLVFQLSQRCDGDDDMKSIPAMMMIWWQSRQCYDLPSPRLNGIPERPHPLRTVWCVCLAPQPSSALIGRSTASSTNQSAGLVAAAG